MTRTALVSGIIFVKVRILESQIIKIKYLKRITKAKT